ncbi:hypothetical protein CK203_058729 [Vitis vinifera]|uniref:Uncharacterized protein n=1 Tax=Vitis vinifera TaxID=29760 RepID=A0A438GLM4_VITVI|nr:hypothetical protein CK203_058729 [Vitis vinifera]
MGEIGAKTEQKQRKTELCEISQLKETSAKEHFVAKPFRNTLDSLREFSQLRRRFGTRVPLRSTGAPFRSCETLRSTVTFISQLRNDCEVAAKMAFCCEIGFFCETQMTLSLPLFLYYTGHLSCEKGFKIERAILADCSSPSSSRHRASLGHLLRSSIPAKFRQPEMARTRGQVFLSFKPQESPARGARSNPISEPPQPKAISPPTNAPQSLGEALSHQVRGSATAKERKG